MNAETNTILFSFFLVFFRSAILHTNINTICIRYVCSKDTTQVLIFHILPLPLSAADLDQWSESGQFLNSWQA